ncbi:MAG TPA: hypothetical protein VLJ80_00525 [Solirubrobacteraceae bacterium]|nr:hypothetical protein [Solirubrobacteraceae bacterium]
MPSTKAIIAFAARIESSLSSPASRNRRWSSRSAVSWKDSFGLAPNASGNYEISEDAEARLLRLAEDEVFETFSQGRGLSEAELEGERPPMD